MRSALKNETKQRRLVRMLLVTDTHTTWYLAVSTLITTNS